MILVSLGAVIISISAWITVPFAIPFTMQTFGVFSVLLLLGGKRGTLSVLLYIALGAIGLPVFSGFNAGFGVLLGITGGFIFGFAVSGALYWALERLFCKHTLSRPIILAVSLAACYAAGTVWYIYSSGSAGIGSAISLCVLPYILPDAVKLLLAYVVAKRVSKYIKA